jgi:outer membrane protein assembly factor BamB
MKPTSPLAAFAARAAWLAVIGLALTAGPVRGATAADTDWPQWRGPDRTGVSKEKGWTTQWPADGPKVLWKAELGKGYSSFSIADGKAYTMGFDGGKDTVWCFQADTGDVVWRHTYPSEAGDYPGPRCTPTVDGKVVYTLGRLGHLFCLDAATGKVVWSKHLVDDFKAERPQWHFACSPLVLGNALILDAGMTIALQKATGETLWKTDPEKAGYSSPMAFMMGDAILLALFPEHGLVVRNAVDGKELGRVRWKTSYGVNAATPILQGNAIFISSGYGVGAAVYAVEGSSLKQVWKNKNMKNHANSCVLWEGHLYGFDGQVDEGPLTCVDVKTGDRKWAEGSLRAGSLMIADGKIIAIGNGGDLAVIEASPDGYKELARAKVLGKTCWTMPILSGGRIYCRNEKGQAVCLDVKGK